jgi:hypothetical protein
MAKDMLVKVVIMDGYIGHRHRGEECQPGDIIEVKPHQAAWLQKIGVAKPVPKKKSVKKTEEAEDGESQSSDQ